MMMTACDLGAVTKPWEISRKVREPPSALFTFNPPMLLWEQSLLLKGFVLSFVIILVLIWS